MPVRSSTLVLVLVVGLLYISGCGAGEIRTTDGPENVPTVARSQAPDVFLPPSTEAPHRTETTTPSVSFEETTTTLVRYLSVRFGGTDYLCDESWNGFEFYDCVRDIGQVKPSFSNIDLYCSGPSFGIECDPDWYPDDLTNYLFLTHNGMRRICQPARFGSTDYDCERYGGGRPPTAIRGDLKCTLYSSGFECLEGPSYPSDWEGYELIRVSGSDFICVSSGRSTGNYDCERYWGGAPPLFLNGNLKCTRYTSGFECLEGSYYPSDWEGYEVITFGWDRYVCKQLLGGILGKWECQKCLGSCRPGAIVWPGLWCDRSWNCSTSR